MSSFSYIPQLQCDNVLLYPDLYVIRVYLVKDKILSPQCKNAKKIYYVINIFRKVNFSWIEYGIEKFSHVHFNGDLELIFFFFFSSYWFIFLSYPDFASCWDLQKIACIQVRLY